MIRRAADDELAGLTGVLAEAFMGDPLYQALAPSPQVRERWLRWVMGMFLHVSHRFGGALCVAGAPGAAAMCLLPPERCHPSVVDYLRAAPGLPPLGSGAPAFVRQGAVAAELLRRAHRRDAHWYLLAVGVAPAAQGRGLGTTLLRSALQIADARGLPCYLETASPRNVGLYEHLGFRVQRTLQPEALPPLWTMLRPATPAAPWVEADGTRLRAREASVL